MQEHSRIRLDFEAGVFGNGNVVAPCWRGQVDRFGTGVVSGQKGSSNSEGSGSGDRLGGGELQLVSARRDTSLAAICRPLNKRIETGPAKSASLTLPSTIGFESLP